MEELALLIQCQKGDRRAQKTLYDRYAKAMVRVCFRYLPETQDAYHVLNEGFLKVFKNIKNFQYREEGLLQAWIKKIMVNEALMFLRKSKSLVFISIDQIPFDVTGYVDQSRDANDILEHIKNLPAGYRAVFNLFVIEGYTHKEIGILLDISESASRSQLTHARMKLKKILTKSGFIYE